MDILKRNNVKVIGNGAQSIVLAPGFGCDQSVWRAVAEAFKNDYTVILFDYVGSGNSDILAYDQEKYSSLTGYAQDVLDVCTALNLKDAILIGHSVGGMIGMLASIQHPKLFSKLVMIGPSPCYTNEPPDYYGGFERVQLLGLLEVMEKNYIGWANMFAATVMNNPSIPEVTRELEDRFCSTDPIIARQFAEATFFSDYREELSLVPIPTLILQCSDDIIAPLGVGEFIHQQIPNSSLKIMKATGHCPHMSHPEETIQLIGPFIKKIFINS